ncbi:xanthine dehydrogenase family protein molybdopterin-binding subunit [Streptomyces sp. NPDC006332]|uniref:xanthine dehydrogenase family protein molybdopterin-binding subunit n=1 Tax=Streptomyces sp. NPDC006332 TaxID=3155456 RepID=UPI0033B15376
MSTTTEVQGKAVGLPHVRVEGRDKVTGAARYAGEVPFPGLVHGWLVLSTIARGRIRSVDTAHVLGMSGVLAVLHHGNALPVDAGFIIPLLGAPPDSTVGLFQHDRVPYLGWPVALVVAETPEQAREAAEVLTVTYEEDPHDVAFSYDRPDVYPLVGPLRPAQEEKGDLDAELAASAVVLDAEYTTPQEHHTAMEPHVVTAHWDEDRLEVLDSNQGSPFIAEHLSKLFSLDPASVRVRTEHVGGAFGSKADVRAHHVAAVMAARMLSRPVRVVLTRRQMFSLTGYRSPTIQRIRLGADTEGKLRALEHRSLCLTSTTYEFVEAGTMMTRVMYDADAHHTVNLAVRLDVPTPSFMRAPGEAPGSFALECAMDELAEKCGIDPIELRLRNEPEQGPLSGLPFSSRNLVACFREGARRFGWAERDPRPGVRREGRWLLGTGTAAATYPAGVAPSSAAVTAHPDGTFTVRIAASDIGTGARTALTLVAADALEVAPECVRVHIGDSDFGPAMVGAASMGTRSWAWAVRIAVGELRERLASDATIPPEGITARANSLAGVGALHQQPKERHAFGAQFAEVAVDPATGEVRVRRMLGIFATGRIVNPLTARSQFIGGMTWGLSMALHEEAAMDAATGGLVGADLAGYHISSHADVPAIEADWVDDPDPDDPVGIKGLGEIGNVGAAAAIANAVWHATGVRHRHLPIRPDRILLATQRA